MKIKQGFDKDTVNQIAKNCGSACVKDTISYITAPFIRGGAGFRCEIIDGVAFFAGTLCKKHFRLYEMAVLESEQKKGYGRLMVMRMKKLCSDHGVEKITLRTSKAEGAINFYYRVGGKIVGEKGEDWEVEITV